MHVRPPNGPIIERAPTLAPGCHSFWKWAIHAFSYVSSSYTGGVNSKKVCFGRKTKFLQESEDFGGNRETWKIFRETQTKEVKISGISRFWGEFLPNIRDDIPDFGDDCHLHMVLLKQRLLELSPHDSYGALRKFGKHSRRKSCPRLSPQATLTLLLYSSTSRQP